MVIFIYKNIEWWSIKLKKKLLKSQNKFFS